MVFYFLHHQMHFFQLPAMFVSRGDDIDAGGVDAAVAQEVRQLCDVLLNGVERAGKKLVQIMGKHLPRFYPRSLTKPLHLRPDVAAVQRSAAFGAEDKPADNARPLGVAQQQLFQLGRQQDHLALSLGVDPDFSVAHCFYGKKAQLGYADARSADGLQEQIQSGSVFGGLQQAQILRFGQLPALRAIDLSLGLQALDPAVLPAQIAQKAVDAGQHGVDAAKKTKGDSDPNGKNLRPDSPRQESQMTGEANNGFTNTGELNAIKD